MTYVPGDFCLMDFSIWLWCFTRFCYVFSPRFGIEYIISQFPVSIPFHNLGEEIRFTSGSRWLCYLAIEKNMYYDRKNMYCDRYNHPKLHYFKDLKLVSVFNTFWKWIYHIPTEEGST